MSERGKTDKEKEALNLTADLWNFMIDIEYDNSDDISDVRRHIHAIQNILYANIYIKESGKL